MSFRGRGRGGGFGGRGRGGGGRGGFRQQNYGPPDEVVGALRSPMVFLCDFLMVRWAELGEFSHACEGEMVCKSTNDKVPCFNSDIYLQNKTKIGKVDEILGAITDVVST